MLKLKRKNLIYQLKLQRFSAIGRKVKYHKSATSKNDCQKYRFEFVK